MNIRSVIMACSLVFVPSVVAKKQSAEQIYKTLKEKIEFYLHKLTRDLVALEEIKDLYNDLLECKQGQYYFEELAEWCVPHVTETSWRSVMSLFKDGRSKVYNYTNLKGVTLAKGTPARDRKIELAHVIGLQYGFYRSVFVTEKKSGVKKDAPIKAYFTPEAFPF